MTQSLKKYKLLVLPFVLALAALAYAGSQTVGGVEFNGSGTITGPSTGNLTVTSANNNHLLLLSNSTGSEVRLGTNSATRWTVGNSSDPSFYPAAVSLGLGRSANPVAQLYLDEKDTAPSTPASGGSVAWVDSSGNTRATNDAGYKLTAASARQTYTPVLTTFSGSWGTAGVDYDATGEYWRHDDRMRVNILVEFHATISGSPSGMTLGLPSGVSLDTGAILSTGTHVVEFGRMHFVGTGFATGTVVHRSGAIDTVEVLVATAGGTYVSYATITESVPESITDGDTFYLTFDVPVLSD